jgi:4-amino-4-deoxy-L-arabinose transferase-like glycosyltransferase
VVPREAEGTGGASTSEWRVGVLVAIVAVAAILRLGFLAFAVGHGERINPDSDVPQYLRLAERPSEAYLGGDGDLVELGLLRTPVFPVALAGPLSLSGGSVPWAVLPFSLLSVGTVGVAYALTKRLFGHRPAVFAAAALAVDPISIVWSGYPQPEVLLAFFLAAGALFVARGLQTGGLGPHAAGGLLLGIAAVTRPIALYLPAVVAVIVAVLPRWTARRRRLAGAGLLLLVASVPIGGWTVRNALVADTPMLSTIETVNLLYYRAAPALSESTGVPLDEARKQLRRRVDADVGRDATPWERANAERRLALEVIREHPGGYLVMAGKGLRYLMFGPGRAPLLKRITGSVDWDTTAKVLVAIAWVPYAATLLACAYGIWIALRDRLWLAVLPLAIGAYLIAVSAGVEAHARFRYPIMPFLVTFAGLGAASAVGDRLANRLHLSQPAT